MRSWFILLLTVILTACNTTVSKKVPDGILEVPENRNDPNSRTLQLVYKVLKAKNPDSLKAPIVFLMGGPGVATISTIEQAWKNHPLRNDRDIVLMDQRGTGASEANCSTIGDAMFDVMRQDLDAESDIRALNPILAQCKESMKRDKVDLAGYNSKENAADFEDLRKALGYKKWNLFGASYGSRLGLTIMRDFPNSVRSAVFSGIVAPENNLMNGSVKNTENAFFAILKRCENNEACNTRFPNLKERILETLKKLQKEPLHFVYDGQPFVLNIQDATTLLSMKLYERNSIGSIPLIIETLEKRDTAYLLNHIKTMDQMRNFLNTPMLYSVIAYEELPFLDELALAEAIQQSEIASSSSSVSSKLYIDAMKNWHPHRAPAMENQAVVSETPTLLISGGLDYVTPTSYGTVALKHLKNGHQVIFPDESHNIYGRCIDQISEDFFNDPWHKPNSSCSTIRNPIEWKLGNH